MAASVGEPASLMCVNGPRLALATIAAMTRCSEKSLPALKPKPAPKPKRKWRMDEALANIESYAEDLRELINKLRQQLH